MFKRQLPEYTGTHERAVAWQKRCAFGYFHFLVATIAFYIVKVIFLLTGVTNVHDAGPSIEENATSCDVAVFSLYHIRHFVVMFVVCFGCGILLVVFVFAHAGLEALWGLFESRFGFPPCGLELFERDTDQASGESRGVETRESVDQDEGSVTDEEGTPESSDTCTECLKLIFILLVSYAPYLIPFGVTLEFAVNGPRMANPFDIEFYRYPVDSCSISPGQNEMAYLAMVYMQRLDIAAFCLVVPLLYLRYLVHAVGKRDFDYMNVWIERVRVSLWNRLNRAELMDPGSLPEGVPIAGGDTQVHNIAKTPKRLSRKSCCCLTTATTSDVEANE